MSCVRRCQICPLSSPPGSLAKKTCVRCELPGSMRSYTSLIAKRNLLALSISSLRGEAPCLTGAKKYPAHEIQELLFRTQHGVVGLGELGREIASHLALVRRRQHSRNTDDTSFNVRFREVGPGATLPPFHQNGEACGVDSAARNGASYGDKMIELFM